MKQTNIKVESAIRQRRNGGGNFPLTKIKKAFDQKIISPHDGGYSSTLPGHYRMARRQLRNLGTKGLKRACKRHIRRINKAEVTNYE